MKDVVGRIVRSYTLVRSFKCGLAAVVTHVVCPNTVALDSSDGLRALGPLNGIESHMR